MMLNKPVKLDFTSSGNDCVNINKNKTRRMNIKKPVCQYKNNRNNELCNKTENIVEAS